MKYSLRSLMIAVTLVCALLGGRVGYLRLMKEYRERELRKARTLDDIGYHDRMAFEYQWALRRPWSFKSDDTSN